MSASASASAAAAATAKRKAAQAEAKAKKQAAKRRKPAEKALPVEQVVDITMPESELYMQLLDFERRLDSTIARKRMDINEALRKPMPVKRTMRLIVSHTCNGFGDIAAPGDGLAVDWTLRIEGRVMDDPQATVKTKRRLTSLLNHIVIDLDKSQYTGSDNIIEWKKRDSSQPGDGFEISRRSSQAVRATIVAQFDHQPPRYKVLSPLNQLLGIHTASRSAVILAMWQYIKNHNLQDANERDVVLCDKFLKQIFKVDRLKFSMLPAKLQSFLVPPDPVVIYYEITVDPMSPKRPQVYDIEIEMEDDVKGSMNHALLATSMQLELKTLSDKIHELVSDIEKSKTKRLFMLNFSEDPQKFIRTWVASQSADNSAHEKLRGSTDAQRQTEFFMQPWAEDAVFRYHSAKLAERRQQLEAKQAERSKEQA